MSDRPPPPPSGLADDRAANDIGPPVLPRGRGCRRIPDWVTTVILIAIVVIVAYWFGVGF